MSRHASLPTDTTLMFQLKGGLYPLTALQLLGNDLPVFERQLTIKIEQAPKFFNNAPVVIDLQKLHQPSTLIDFKKLIEILLHKKLIPVGIKGGLPEQQAAAALAGLPTLQEGTKETQKTEAAAELPPAALSIPPAEIAGKKPVDSLSSNSRIIKDPIRSGQQIYARGGDLIVLAPVSHGAELLADGNIHIYGPLRGRALAGVSGDPNAHIFCQSLEAELISIAGQYKISEDIDPALWRLPVDISLDAGRLHIRPL